ncbi:MAG: TatD family hydrolase [Nitrososphaerota archaeon]
MEFIDTHAHISLFALPHKRQRLIEKAKKVGVKTIIEVGINLESSSIALELAKKNDAIFASCGIHPNDGKEDLEMIDWEEKLTTLVQQPKVVAVGECGLDYYRSSNNKKEQQILFVKQLELANKFNLPVIIHCRNAWSDLFSILSSFPQTRGIFHCWSGSYKDAEKAVDYNFLFGFGGLITYPNTDKILEVAVNLPIWRIVLETDSPFLIPYQLKSKGNKNEPANIAYVAQFLASLRSMRIGELATATTANAKRLFLINK